ncbi:hypothetical protein BH92_27495 (plasmid) [Rhodococcoides fascians A21d2]|nr:hypothetical protein BH92_27495 [Rhodococcus fascians A21d2]
MNSQHFCRDIAGAVDNVHSSGGHLLPEEDAISVADEIREFLHCKDAS